MAHINLLPWREQVREDRKRYFFIALGGTTALSVVLMVIVHLGFSSEIKHQKNINRLLTTEIAELDKRILAIKDLKEKRTKLLVRMSIIQELQANRPLTVRVFDQLVKIIPDGVYFTSVNRKEKVLTVSGEAESNTRVSALMRNIKDSKWLYAPLLTEIKKDKTHQLHSNYFELRMHQRAIKQQVEVSSGKNGAY